MPDEKKACLHCVLIDALTAEAEKHPDGALKSEDVLNGLGRAMLDIIMKCPANRRYEAFGQFITMLIDNFNEENNRDRDLPRSGVDAAKEETRH